VALAAADPRAAEVYRDLARALPAPAAVERALAADRIRDEARCEVLKGKIHRAVVTQADVDYVGSITLDPELLEAADIVPGEAVHVLDIDNGERLVTYAIPGRRGSGDVGMNGAAARKIWVGHRVIVLSYVQVPLRLRRDVEPRIVLVDDANRPLRG
jgi:aspartate 1-decarboxylase